MITKYRVDKIFNSLTRYVDDVIKFTAECFPTTGGATLFWFCHSVRSYSYYFYSKEARRILTATIQEDLPPHAFFDYILEGLAEAKVDYWSAHKWVTASDYERAFFLKLLEEEITKWAL